MKYSFIQIKDSLQFDVKCLFIKNNSWIKIKTEKILNHEQGHFNLAEIYCRKLRNALLKTNFKLNDYEAISDSIFRLYQDSCDKQQDLYDLETNYSLDTKQQLIWEKIIKADLEKWNFMMENSIQKRLLK
jgi:hypothetical protein